MTHHNKNKTAHRDERQKTKALRMARKKRKLLVRVNIAHGRFGDALFLFPGECEIYASVRSIKGRETTSAKDIPEEGAAGDLLPVYFRRSLCFVTLARMEWYLHAIESQ